MKKITVILLSAALILTACLFCSCDAPAQTADSGTFVTDDRPNGMPPVGEPAENIGNLIDGKEITQVYVSLGNNGDTIYPLYEYEGGGLNTYKHPENTPVKTYPITVEFRGDFVTVNYYVVTDSGAASRSVLTGKDNVIIYLK